MSGAVSVITTRTQLAGFEKRMDAEAAQVREIFRARDQVDEATLGGVRSDLSWLKSSVERLERRMDQKFGDYPDMPQVYAYLVADLPAEIPKLIQRPLIFDDKLAKMRARLDELIEMLKNGKLDNDEKLNELYSLEIDFEITKGWQIWCETNERRRQQCLQYLKGE